ncbi:hypothetical protein N431DRAFT_520983 [Stipitochalara longipes BDJ]|nr:hypothetical protein N431DRAFT_520983 [Stipitochalara longipes BDJ]
MGSCGQLWAAAVPPGTGLLFPAVPRSSRPWSATSSGLSGRRVCRGPRPSTSSALNHEIRAASLHSCTSFCCEPTAAGLPSSGRARFLLILPYISHIRKDTALPPALDHGIAADALIHRASERGYGMSSRLVSKALFPVIPQASCQGLPQNNRRGCKPRASERSPTPTSAIPKDQWSQLFQKPSGSSGAVLAIAHGFCTFPPAKSAAFGGAEHTDTDEESDERVIGHGSRHRPGPGQNPAQRPSSDLDQQSKISSSEALSGRLLDGLVESETSSSSRRPIRRGSLEDLGNIGSHGPVSAYS